MKNILIILFISFMTYGCKKEKNEPAPTAKTFTYVSLVADSYEIKQGNVTRITATVNGEVNYVWTCSSGDLFGSGNSILFGAGSCCTGDHKITCEVADTNGNKESKSVNVMVN
jgi:hypothetical protein